MDGTWLLESKEREVCGDKTEEEAEQEDGRYTREGSTIRFTDKDGKAEDTDGTPGAGVDIDDLVSGSVAESTLTVTLDDGNTLTFRR